MPNTHLIFEIITLRKQSQHLFAETKNALNSLVLIKIQNDMLLYQNFQMHAIRLKE